MKQEVVNINEQKPLDDKVSFGKVLAWSTRGFSLSANVILLMQLTYYATDIIGLNPGLVGALLLGSKVFDGVTDLLVGFIIDRTYTRFGKGRPFELFIIPTWLFTILIFSTPNWSSTLQAVYIFILYSLINSVCTTFLNGSEAVFLGRAVKGDVGRAKMLSIGGVLAMVMGAVVSIILPLLMNTWGMQPGGWTRIALVIGVPMMIIGLLRFIFVKEKVDTSTSEEREAQKINVKDAFKALTQNKYVFILGAGVLLANIAMNMGVANTYYFLYVVGDLSVMSLAGMIGLLVPFVLLLFPWAMRHIGAMNFVRIGLIVAIVGNIIKYFAGANIPMVIVGHLLAGLGANFLTMMIGMFLIQAMDYGEWKTGKRVEGTLNSITSFSSKIGSAIASGGIGIFFAWAGYVGQAEVQTESAMTAIIWAFSLIPAIICVIMLVILHFYDLDKRMPQIQEELKNRKDSVIY